jgi:hypothetical protein
MGQIFKIGTPMGNVEYERPYKHPEKKRREFRVPRPTRITFQELILIYTRGDVRVAPPVPRNAT